MSNSITELFIKHGGVNFLTGTDKFTVHSYAPIYEIIFNNYKDKCTALLEIGIYTGAALAAYSEYFTNSSIFGIDIEDSRLEKYKNIERTHVYIGNALDYTTIHCFEDQKYDIIIEDASHEPSHQKQHFTDYSKFIKDGGVYIIEDVRAEYLSNVWNHVNKIATENGFVCLCINLNHKKGLPDDILIISIKSDNTELIDKLGVFV